MTKYYLDACIWRDYLENRSDKFRPLGEWAFGLIKKIIDEEGLFVISDHLINELKSNKIEEIVPNKLIVFVNFDYIQTRRASKLSKKFRIPKGDALHAILAKDHNAILITRDNHFNKIYGYLDIMKPEDLI